MHKGELKADYYTDRKHFFIQATPWPPMNQANDLCGFFSKHATAHDFGIMYQSAKPQTSLSLCLSLHLPGLEPLTGKLADLVWHI